MGLPALPDRADVRNAQDKAMLYELNDAFDLAAQDDEVVVVWLPMVHIFHQVMT